MSELLQIEMFDKLVPFITWISKPKKRIRFSLPADFCVSEHSMQCFVSQWEHRWERGRDVVNDMGFPIAPGPVLGQILTISTFDDAVFDYLFNKVLEATAKGMGDQEFSVELCIEF